MSEPVHVLITGAAGQIAYSLIPYVCQGYIFGPNQPVILHLLDIEPAMAALNGVVMEIEDLAYPLVAGVIATHELEPAFKNVDYVIFLGAFPRKQGMERKDLLDKNVGIFKGQGVALGKFAKKTCKCVVVGNPANTNCLTLMAHCPEIPKENFSALTRLDHNRLVSAVGIKAGAHVEDVSDVFIWGNHSSTQFPDIFNGKVGAKSAVDAVGGLDWYKSELIPKIQKRGAAVIAARGLSSAASAAKASADHMRDWVQGTSKPISMAVSSDGNPYGVPEGLIYSFPVTCSGGKWTIVPGYPISDYAREKMVVTATELVEEKTMSAEILAAK